ncbi:MAG: TIGR00282 family metallophosphoesterase [Erysipelotrichaceae bacterium]|nr:TIGR00282 family metallophosphoesterase [Erysipelotrichaceae bacterium]
MKILFLGDVVAKSGREAVIRNIQSLKAEYDADFVIVNGENAAHGKGITVSIYNRLVSAGADIVTLGNHAFSKKEIIANIDLCPRLVRPLNLSPTDIGSGVSVIERAGKKIAVVSVLCEAFMCPVEESPISAVEKILGKLNADLVIVDLHGESTGEKIIFARYFADRLSAVIGTHTHVQTADERILNGCAFISDVGMCGAYDSVLGRDVEEMIAHTIEKKPTRYVPASGPAIICGCLIETDDETNRAVKITRIQKTPSTLV